MKNLPGFVHFLAISALLPIHSANAIIDLETMYGSSESSQIYPAMQPALQDIYDSTRLPGPATEIVQRCVELDHFASYLREGYCARPQYIPINQSFVLAGSAISIYWGVTAISCTPNCGDPVTEIDNWYATEVFACQWNTQSPSGWVFAEHNQDPVTSGDGTAEYTVEHSNSAEAWNVVRRNQYTNQCPDPLPEGSTEGFAIHSESASRSCPTGYHTTTTVPPSGILSCGNFYEAFVHVHGPEKEQSLGQCASGNPCHPTTGSKSLTQADFDSPTLPLTRYWQSEMKYPDYAAMGPGWSHNYSERILTFSATQVRHLGHTGHVERFHCVDSPTCSLYRSQSKSGSLLRPLGNGWELLTPGGKRREFDDQGRLIAVEDRSGAYRNTQISYNADGHVDVVMDQQGRSLQFNYNADGLVSSVDLPSGQSIQYEYTKPPAIPASQPWRQQLTRVVREDLSEIQYHYEDQHPDTTPRYEFLVTGVTDENGNRYSTFAYDDHARPVSSELAGGVDRVTLEYTQHPGQTENWTITKLTRPLGAVETYEIDPGVYRQPTGISDSRGDITLAYDPATTWRTSRTDREGHQTTYEYADGLHETRRTEALGTLDERIIETDWDTTVNQVTERRQPGKTTTYTHNARGQVLTRTETDTATLDTRTWTYTYFEVPSIAELIGQLQSVDGPRTDVADVTTYAYYTSDDPGGQFLKGDLYTITNALGHVTEYLEYDGNGRPLAIADANGVQTTLTYHPRGWLQSRTTDGQTTSFSYDGAGNLLRVTQPDGAFIAYEYDAAHRLDAMQDNFGNRIEYTLDAAGNRTAEQTYNDQAVLRRQLTRVYDQLGRLEKIIDGNLHETAYAYDANGNRSSTLDANLNTTAFEYDALDRLVKSIDAALGETLMSYDARDNLASVTDPLGNTTSYTLDGLDNQTALDSPDTGTTVYEYDEAGNRVSATDARNVRVEYEYDALNRLTFVDYLDDSLDVTFTYDAGSNGKGRLTSMADAAGTETYSYDARGNLVSVARSIGAANYSTDYAYNGADRLTQITYPSGMVIDYALDAAGRVIAVDQTVDSVTENLVTGVSYEPFGPVSDFTYGNGLTMSATFGLDYELDGLESGPLDWLFGHDPVGNILTIDDQNEPALDQGFTYDDLYRLETAAGGYGSEAFEYDANGNRERFVDDLVDESYTYEASSNRLATRAGWTYSRDPAGNRTAQLDSSGYGMLYAYGDHNRLVEVTARDAQGDTVVGTYVIDGRGQRVSKTTAEGTRHFIYGLNGELLGEYVDGETELLEYVWFNGQPVALHRYSEQLVIPPAEELILDNGESGTSSTGSWGSDTDSETYGADHSKANKSSSNTYRWTVTPPGPTYNVYAWWVSHNSFSSQAEYTVSYNSGQSDTQTRSQKTNGGQWNLLGSYTYSGGQDYVEVSAANGKTSADAIRWVYQPEPSLQIVSETLFIHTDHLGTPRRVSDDSQTVIWRWDSRPFGDTSPDEDPDGNQVEFSLNLRFPGQYFDTESVLNYNFFRDYAPSIGRYVESDPIGLSGGLNSYIYSANDPIAMFDSLGLTAECTVPKEEEAPECRIVGRRMRPGEDPLTIYQCPGESNECKVILERVVPYSPGIFGRICSPFCQEIPGKEVYLTCPPYIISVSPRCQCNDPGGIRG